MPDVDVQTQTGKDFLSNYEARFGTVAALAWFQRAAYDDVYNTAECLSGTGNDGVSGEVSPR